MNPTMRENSHLPNGLPDSRRQLARNLGPIDPLMARSLDPEPEAFVLTQELLVFDVVRAITGKVKANDLPPQPEWTEDFFVPGELRLPSWATEADPFPF